MSVRESIRLNSSIIRGAWFRSSRLILYSFVLSLSFSNATINFSSISKYLFIQTRGAGKFQFLSVLFFFKQEGQEGKFSYFTATMFTGEEWNDFRVIRREAHTSSTLSLNPGFVLLYANQSTPTYVALRVLSSSLRGWFLARTEIACNLRSEFLSHPSPCSSLHAPGVHVHPGRSDVSLTLIQRW